MYRNSLGREISRMQISKYAEGILPPTGVLQASQPGAEAVVTDSKRTIPRFYEGTPEGFFTRPPHAREALLFREITDFT